MVATTYAAIADDRFSVRARIVCASSSLRNRLDSRYCWRLRALRPLVVRPATRSSSSSLCASSNSGSSRPSGCRRFFFGLLVLDIGRLLPSLLQVKSAVARCLLRRA